MEAALGFVGHKFATRDVTETEDVLKFTVLHTMVTVVATKHVAVDYRHIGNGKPMVITQKKKSANPCEAALQWNTWCWRLFLQSCSPRGR